MRKMSGILLFTASLVAIPVSVRLVMALFEAMARRPQNQKSITGRIDNVMVESPHYTDTNRVGSRITFDFQIFAHEITKLVQASVHIADKDHTAYERPLFRPNIFPYVVRRDDKLALSGSVYVDDVRPEAINKNTITIELTDVTGVKYFI
jgi:hypothetical protein